MSKYDYAKQFTTQPGDKFGSYHMGECEVHATPRHYVDMYMACPADAHADRLFWFGESVATQIYDEWKQKPDGFDFRSYVDGMLDALNDYI